jgi:hypothetical protein
MNQITVDPTTGLQLRNAEEPVQIVDQDGRVIGCFAPVVDMSLYAMVEPPSSLEELMRRAGEGGGRTWPEIKADLEKRP